MSMHQRGVLGRLRDRLNRTIPRYVMREQDEDRRRRGVEMRLTMWAHDPRHAAFLRGSMPRWMFTVAHGQGRPRMITERRDHFAEGSDDEKDTAYLQSGGSDGNADKATDHQQAGTGTDHRRGAE